MKSFAELLAAGSVGFQRLAWAAQRAPRPVLFGAAVAGLAAFVHFTGFVPGAGATGFVPHVTSPRTGAGR